MAIPHLAHRLSFLPFRPHGQVRPYSLRSDRQRMGLTGLQWVWLHQHLTRVPNLKPRQGQIHWAKWKLRPQVMREILWEGGYVKCWLVWPTYNCEDVWAEWLWPHLGTPIPHHYKSTKQYFLQNCTVFIAGRSQNFCHKKIDTPLGCGFTLFFSFFFNSNCEKNTPSFSQSFIYSNLNCIF